ncbi:MAG TPA: hypothetical protein VFF67_03210 [Thermoplasmata archaeon]|nr:hypothetical protein [Thermoplasmata archaeon]
MPRTIFQKLVPGRRALAVGAIVVALAFMATLAPFGRAAGVNSSYCSTSPLKILNHTGVPFGSPRLVSIHWDATNHEDFGRLGYWAIDNFTASVRAWQISSGHYYATEEFNGTWHTYAGALSPRLGNHEFLSKGGPFGAGVNFTFSAKFVPKLNVTGKIGPYNYNGSIPDVLKGKYANQTGDANTFNWVREYFVNVSVSSEFFGYVYNWAPGGQTWCHFDHADGGSSGDIVT